VDLYRRLARLTSEAAVDDFASELSDRFGPMPAVALHLLELARLRIWAHSWGVNEIRIEGAYAVLGYTSREKIQRLVAKSGRRLRVADASSAYLPLTDRAAGPAGAFDEVKTLLRPDARAA
jgi:transcription-repair coupling factor (superfamily II helicase)